MADDCGVCVCAKAAREKLASAKLLFLEKQSLLQDPDDSLEELLPFLDEFKHGARLMLTLLAKLVPQQVIPAVQACTRENQSFINFSRTHLPMKEYLLNGVRKDVDDARQHCHLDFDVDPFDDATAVCMSEVFLCVWQCDEPEHHRLTWFTEHSHEFFV